MDKLPLEILLKIASCCDYAAICAMSKLNRRWNEVIESNWKPLKKFHVEQILWDDECPYDDEKSVEIWTRRYSPTKTLKLHIGNGTQNVNAAAMLEGGWQVGRYRKDEPEYAVRPLDADKYLEDLFATVFRRSTIHRLQLNSLKPSSLQVVIGLLEQFRPSIYVLDMKIGYRSESILQEFENAANFVKLAKPKHIDLAFSDWLTREDVREHFMRKILHQKFSKLTINSALAYEKNAIYPSSLGPLPNCSLLRCVNRQKTMPLSIDDIVDLIEEWSHNRREIVMYCFERWSNDDMDSAKIMRRLRARNLQVHVEAQERDNEYAISKRVARGDDQDELLVEFPDYPSAFWNCFPCMVVSSKRGWSVHGMRMQNFEPCPHC